MTRIRLIKAALPELVVERAALSLNMTQIIVVVAVFQRIAAIIFVHDLAMVDTW
jgi:hypothetical protein